MIVDKNEVRRVMSEQDVKFPEANKLWMESAERAAFMAARGGEQM